MRIAVMKLAPAVVVLASVILMLSACAGEEMADSHATALDFTSFDQALEAAIAAHNTAMPAAPIRGASAIVVHADHGLLYSKGYGEFAADRLYLVASSSKILSVGVLMRLADQNLVQIDGPIGPYLSAWGQTTASALTLGQLFSNSSGLPSLSEVSAVATDTASPYYSNLCQYNHVGTLADCGKLLYATEPLRAPDTKFTYGGSQWQLAGAVAEQVSGKSWAQLIDETYATPCQMPSLGYTNQFATAGTMYPTTFQGVEANLQVTSNPSIEGGAYVTAPDYAKVLLMHLRGGMCDGGRVLSDASVLAMQEDRIAKYGGMTGNPLANGYGLGWWLATADRVISDPGAYGAYPWLDLERGYGAMILIEVTSTVGGQLAAATKPVLDAIVDQQLDHH
jgi:CubicO group peptidase (beta-lactamase class C family)